MTTTPPRPLVAVRADIDVIVVALVARDETVVRAIRVISGLDAVDARIRELIDADIPGGLPGPSEPSVVAAENRLRDGMAAARVRLAADAETIVTVRFPGRLHFVAIDRAEVVRAIAPTLAAVVAAVEELTDGDELDVLALDGAATVPGLLDALPGESVASDGIDLEALAIGIAQAPVELVVPASLGASRGSRSEAGSHPEVSLPRDIQRTAVPDAEPEPVEAQEQASEPIEEGTGEVGVVELASFAPRAVARAAESFVAAIAALHRLWPAVTAVVVVLALGGAAAALGLSARPFDSRPVDPSPARTGDERATARPTSSPSPSSGPTTAPDPSNEGAPGTGTGDAAPRRPTTKRGAGSSGSGTQASAPMGQTSGSDPVPPTDSAPPSDPAPTALDPGTPSDPRPPDPTITDPGAPPDSTPVG